VDLTVRKLTRRFKIQVHATALPTFLSFRHKFSLESLPPSLAPTWTKQIYLQSTTFDGQSKRPNLQKVPGHGKSETGTPFGVFTHPFPTSIVLFLDMANTYRNFWLLSGCSVQLKIRDLVHGISVKVFVVVQVLHTACDWAGLLRFWYPGTFSFLRTLKTKFPFQNVMQPCIPHRHVKRWPFSRPTTHSLWQSLSFL
jgi:hypothetical protein